MSSSEHGFVKQKWCDSMYFLAMDHDMTKTKDKTVALTRLTLRAMVRITCSRSGAFSKDWFDRAGLQVQWSKKHVLRVKDFKWSRVGLTVEFDEVIKNCSALRTGGS